jgi:hypothetical protein
VSTPKTCTGCGVKPVARKTLRFCFGCRPGGPYPEPPCRRCGSTTDYFSAGLCGRCHQYAPQRPDGCRDCHAWGVMRTHKWLCLACAGWRERNPTVGSCMGCGHERPISDRGACRLCWLQASMARDASKRQRPYRPLDIMGANRSGQQLFFADLGRRRRPRPGDQPSSATVVVSSRRRGAGRQLGLFDAQPATWASRRGLPEPAKTPRSIALDALVRDYAVRHGWSRTTIKRTRCAIRVLLSRQTRPDEAIRTSTVVALQDEGLPSAPVLAVLAEAGLLHDDRIPAIVSWFDRQVAELPSQMAGELRVWFDVLHLGSTTAPRSRPRAAVTIRTRLRWALPVLQAWATQGHCSLREISRADVVAVLPGSGNARATAGTALRSIFATLKDRKVIFTNPMTRVAIGSIERRQPLPLDVEQLRSAFHSDKPSCAALAALLVFHGLRPEQLRRLQLTDIRDGRLLLDSGPVLLADPVRQRVGAWLDHRNRRWPNTANPHMFIHLRTATGTGPIGHTWIGRNLGISPKAVRVDRILEEANATGGDVRRLCDLFGLSVSAAVRYVDPLDRPGVLEGSAVQGEASIP